MLSNVNAASDLAVDARYSLVNTYKVEGLNTFNGAVITQRGPILVRMVPAGTDLEMSFYPRSMGVEATLLFLSRLESQNVKFGVSSAGTLRGSCVVDYEQAATILEAFPL